MQAAHGLLAGGAVDQSEPDIQVPGAAGVLLQNVDHDPCRRGPGRGSQESLTVQARMRRGSVAKAQVTAGRVFALP